jgi:aromatic-L-amino-acid/L-tryptophan decarboxylase
MDNETFRKHAHQLVDWIADYRNNISDYPVKPDVLPGDIKKQLPAEAPQLGEDFEQVFEDFKKIIVPGITHWQHPQFFAYFPSGGSMPSLLADMLSGALSAQCMLWLTSPAAAELEERMMDWLRDLIGLPKTFTGVIQDTSSSATLVAMLTAREKKSSFNINKNGFTGTEQYRIYTSEQAHSSVDKGARISGIGMNNLIKIKTDEQFALIPEELERAIQEDIATGLTPLCVVTTIGTTSSTAVDPIKEIAAICKRYDIWHHIDASYSGTALMLPEMRWMGEGMEDADSFVVNPHKWMFTHFDCSAYFVKDKVALTDTFGIMPEYLKTEEDKLVNNYRDWGIPLGRRFRALKLWFVMRTYGVTGMQEKIRNHIAYGQWLKEEIEHTPGFEILAPVPVNLVCFRLKPPQVNDEQILDHLNTQLLNRLNNSGRIMLTQTRLNGKYCIRFVAGIEETKKEEVAKGWALIKEMSQILLNEL